jgi:hypothetical protein
LFFSLLYTDNDDDIASLSIKECTTELQASIGNHIRIVFYPISNIRNDYDQDYFMSIPKTPCLKIRDVCLKKDLRLKSFVFILES